MSEPSREFLLAAMRAASVRARLMELELKTIGTALASDMITVPKALQWLEDVGALGLIGDLPDAIAEVRDGRQ